LHYFECLNKIEWNNLMWKRNGDVEEREVRVGTIAHALAPCGESGVRVGWEWAKSWRGGAGAGRCVGTSLMEPTPLSRTTTVHGTGAAELTDMLCPCAVYPRTRRTASWPYQYSYVYGVWPFNMVCTGAQSLHKSHRIAEILLLRNTDHLLPPPYKKYLNFIKI
jgi:hypothetical protein